MTLGEFNAINASTKITVSLSEGGNSVGYLDVDYTSDENDNVLPLVYLCGYEPVVKTVSAIAKHQVFVVVDIKECDAGIRKLDGIVWFRKEGEE